jgi:hypothetical protein
MNWSGLEKQTLQVGRLAALPAIERWNGLPSPETDERS